jgi:hypothetical protein
MDMDVDMQEDDHHHHHHHHHHHNIAVQEPLSLLVKQKDLPHKQQQQPAEMNGCPPLLRRSSKTVSAAATTPTASSPAVDLDGTLTTRVNSSSKRRTSNPVDLDDDLDSTNTEEEEAEAKAMEEQFSMPTGFSSDENVHEFQTMTDQQQQQQQQQKQERHLELDALVQDFEEQQQQQLLEPVEKQAADAAAKHVVETEIDTHYPSETPTLEERLFGGDRSVVEQEIYFVEAEESADDLEDMAPNPKQTTTTNTTKVVRRSSSSTTPLSWSLPPRTPRSNTNTTQKEQAPPMTTPKLQHLEQPLSPTSKQQQQQQQRFRLSPSFKEIICKFHTKKKKSSSGSGNHKNGHRHRSRRSHHQHQHRRRSSNSTSSSHQSSSISSHSDFSYDDIAAASPSLSQSSSSVFSDISSLSGGGGGGGPRIVPPRQQMAAAGAPPSTGLLPPRTNYQAIDGGGGDDEEDDDDVYGHVPHPLAAGPSISKKSMEFPLNAELADQQVSSQMIAMGKELLKQFLPAPPPPSTTTGEGIPSSQDLAASPLLSSRISMALFASPSKDPSSSVTKRVLILVMDPHRRIFEVVPASLPTNPSAVCTVGDLLAQIPYQATDVRLKFQEYTGICQRGMHLARNHILPRDLIATTKTTTPFKSDEPTVHDNDDDGSASCWTKLTNNKPLFAIPSHFTAGQIELFGSTLLQNPKVIRMIHDHQVLWGIQ